MSFMIHPFIKFMSNIYLIYLFYKQHLTYYYFDESYY